MDESLRWSEKWEGVDGSEGLALKELLGRQKKLRVELVAKSNIRQSWMGASRVGGKRAGQCVNTETRVKIETKSSPREQKPQWLQSVYRLEPWFNKLKESGWEALADVFSAKSIC